MKTQSFEDKNKEKDDNKEQSILKLQNDRLKLQIYFLKQKNNRLKSKFNYESEEDQFKLDINKDINQINGKKKRKQNQVLAQTKGNSYTDESFSFTSKDLSFNKIEQNQLNQQKNDKSHSFNQNDVTIPQINLSLNSSVSQIVVNQTFLSQIENPNYMDFMIVNKDILQQKQNKSIENIYPQPEVTQLNESYTAQQWIAIFSRLNLGSIKEQTINQLLKKIKHMKLFSQAHPQLQQSEEFKGMFGLNYRNTQQLIDINIDYMQKIKQLHLSLISHIVIRPWQSQIQINNVFSLEYQNIEDIYIYRNGLFHQKNGKLQPEQLDLSFLKTNNHNINLKGSLLIKCQLMSLKTATTLLDIKLPKVKVVHIQLINPLSTQVLAVFTQNGFRNFNKNCQIIFYTPTGQEDLKCYHLSVNRRIKFYKYYSSDDQYEHERILFQQSQ